MQKGSAFGETGFAHILLLIILLVGLVAGVYLVQQTQIFKPKAMELNPNSSIYSLNELDNPPSLITYADPLRGGLDTLTDIGGDAGYGITFDETSTEPTITIDPNIEPKDPILVLENMDIYYLRTLVWILLDLHEQPTHPIDPWYVLCGILSNDKLQKLGVEPTIKKNNEWLGCDEEPDKEQFSVYSQSHRLYIYKKIPVSELVEMMETARLIREGVGIGIDAKAKDFATEIIPGFGAYFALQHSQKPGGDPVSSVAWALPSMLASTLSVFGSGLAFPVLEKIPVAAKYLTHPMGVVAQKVSSYAVSKLVPQVEEFSVSAVVIYVGNKYMGKVAAYGGEQTEKYLEKTINEALVEGKPNGETVTIKVVNEPLQEPTQE